MIRIKSSERFSLIGTTGWGKTVLARYLLAPLRRVIVIDPKHKFSLDGFWQAWDIPITRREFKLIYRPRMNDDGDLARLLYEAMRRENITIYCDELNSLAENFPLATLQLKDIARMGRELKVGVWSAMQRPRDVPKSFLTETEVWAVFNLRSPDDRAHVAGFVGPELKLPAEMEHSFWYIRPGMTRAKLLRLDTESPDAARVSGVIRELTPTLQEV